MCVRERERQSERERLYMCVTGERQRQRHCMCVYLFPFFDFANGTKLPGNTSRTLVVCARARALGFPLTHSPKHHTDL